MMLGGQQHAAPARQWAGAHATGVKAHDHFEQVPVLAASRAQSAERDGAGGPPGGSVAADVAAAQSGAKTILTGTLLDVEASCPAASVALTLAFLQTNDEAAAAMFRMPGVLKGWEWGLCIG